MRYSIKYIGKSVIEQPILNLFEFDLKTLQNVFLENSRPSSIDVYTEVAKNRKKYSYMS